MTCLLPPSLAAYLTGHCTAGGGREHELVQRRAEYQPRVVAQLWPYVVHAAELAQTDHLEGHHCDGGYCGQKAEQRHADRYADQDRRGNRERDHHAGEGLQQRLRERVACEQALSVAGETSPLALA